MDNRVKSYVKGALFGLLGAATVAAAATFNLFQPATGVLVGNSSTYVTTAAAASDILNAIGSQSAHAVMVGPTSGSATPTFRVLVASDIPTISAATQLSGILAVANGGNGTATPTLTQGANVTITGSWPNYTIAAAGGTGCTTGNPTASVGLSIVNGSAVSCMRTDGAPSLSQAIAPTWSARHIFGLSYTGAATEAIDVDSGNPGLGIRNTSAATDQKLWLFNGASNGNFVLYAVNDAESTLNAAFQATRSGATVASVTIGNATNLPTITLDGATTINTPASGIALTVNAFSGLAGINIAGNVAGGSGGAAEFTDGGTGNHQYLVGAGVGGTGLFGIFDFTNGVTRLQISPTGTVTVDAPTSGTALVVNGISGQNVLNITNVTGQGANLSIFDNGGTQNWDVGGAVSTTHMQIFDVTHSVTAVDFAPTTGLATFSGGSHGLIYQFNVSLLNTGSTFNACYGGCGSLSVSRAGTGVFQITHNIGVASLEWTCSMQNTAGSAPMAIYTSTTNGNVVNVDTFSIGTSPTLTDPPTGVTFNCVAMYPT